jgi:hypothetical protein
MISRKTTIALADLYVQIFRRAAPKTMGMVGSRRSTIEYKVDTVKLYDFLYERDYSTWFCNLVRDIKSSSSTRPLKDFIMKLHTGETISSNTKQWSWEQREKLGQRFIKDLTEDIINYWEKDYDDYSKSKTEKIYKNLISRIELDGYLFKESKLLMPEEDVLDVVEETGVLRSLFEKLDLSNKEVAFHHLDLSEEHYINKKWDDSISNSRKFLECILQEVAMSYNKRFKDAPLAESVYNRPFKVRNYLEKEELLESKEKEAMAKVYGLLSETGSHPYMALNDQARLLRHLALTFSQFVMLRLDGKIKNESS